MTRSLAILVLVIGVALGSPSLVSAQATQVPAPLVQRHHRLAGVIGAGVLVFSAGWVASLVVSADLAVVGATYNDFGVHVIPAGMPAWGVVPFIGPLVQMSYAGWTDAGYAYLLADSIVQLAGLAMVIAGIVGIDVLESEPAPGVSMRIAPLLGTTQGVSLELTF